EIMALFGELHRQGQTIVLVTHEHDIAAYAHRTVTLRDGRIESDVRRGETTGRGDVIADQWRIHHGGAR
ncbi:MAG TPA: hypothetical protein VF192_07375, partial [Longimicrobiales bacterium]